LREPGIAIQVSRKDAKYRKARKKGIAAK